MPEPINVTAIAVAVMGIAGTVVGWVVNRKPAQADYAAKLMEATVPAYESLSKRLATVEKEAADCERRNDHLEEKCEAMVRYLRSVGLDVPNQ